MFYQALKCMKIPKTATLTFAQPQTAASNAPCRLPHLSAVLFSWWNTESTHGLNLWQIVYHMLIDEKIPLTEILPCTVPWTAAPKAVTCRVLINLLKTCKIPVAYVLSSFKVHENSNDSNFNLYIAPYSSVKCTLPPLTSVGSIIQLTEHVIYYFCISLPLCIATQRY